MSSLATASPVCFVLTADRGKLVPFYRDTLGLPIASEDDFGVAFALAGGGTLRLVDLAGHTPSEHPVLGWAVSDIRAAVRELAAKGVTFDIYEGFGQDAEGICSTPDGGTKVAWFKDTEGNGLSLAQFG